MECFIGKPKNKVIRFSVESNGASRDQYLECFRKNGLKIDPCHEKTLESFRFKPTSGVKKEIAIILSGRDSFNSQKINRILDGDDFKSPEIETAFLILDKVSRWKAVKGLSWIVVNHKSIDNRLISIDLDPNCQQIIATSDYSGRVWPGNGGFAFEVVSPKRLDSVMKTINALNSL